MIRGQTPLTDATYGMEHRDDKHAEGKFPRGGAIAVDVDGSSMPRNNHGMRWNLISAHLGSHNGHFVFLLRSSHKFG